LDQLLERKLKGKIGLRRELCGWLERFDLLYARKALKILQVDLGYQLTDNAYSSLAFQIALQADCLRNNRTLELPTGLLEDIRTAPVFSLAGNVLESNSEVPAEAVKESEIGYLSVLIQCAQRRYTVSSIMERQDQLEIDPDLDEIVTSIMSTAATYLHPALQRDKILAQALCYHLRTALFRLKYEIPIRNPSLEESQQKYPYIHKVARISCVFFSSKIGRIIPEEEIGKITMHLAAAVERLRIDSKIKKKVIVICGEGISTAWLVVSRLNAKFPEIEILEIMSAREVARMRSFPGEMDGMISTVPLEIPGIPIIEVSPLLNEQDQIGIKEGLRLGQRSRSEPSDEMFGRSLKQFMQLDLISPCVNADSWQDVVRAAGSLLLSARAVEECYIEAMIKAVEVHGPYVVVFPGIALLHARPDEGVLRPALSLITLQKPVNFGHPDHDPVDIAFALSAVDDTSHTGMLLELIDALRNPDIVKKIRSAQNAGEVQAAFSV
jgi:mannitol/fructose-specific phosphotransferase system IIA component (Ntr-type)